MAGQRLDVSCRDLRYQSVASGAFDWSAWWHRTGCALTKRRSAHPGLRRGSLSLHGDLAIACEYLADAALARALLQHFDLAEVLPGQLVGGFEAEGFLKFVLGLVELGLLGEGNTKIEMGARVGGLEAGGGLEFGRSLSHLVGGIQFAGELKMGFPKSRLRLDGLAKPLDRLGVPAQLGKRLPHAEERHGVLRPLLLRTGEFAERELQFSLTKVDVAQLDPALGQHRVHCQRLRKGRVGFISPALQRQHSPQLEFSQEIEWQQFFDSLPLFRRLAQIANRLQELGKALAQVMIVGVALDHR